MGSAVNSFLGGVGQIGGDLMSGNFGGALSSLGSDILGAPGWIGSQLGGLFGGGPTGQPMAGSPSASTAGLSQAVPNVAGGGSGSPMSAVTAASDMTPGGGAPSAALTQALNPDAGQYWNSGPAGQFLSADQNSINAGARMTPALTSSLLPAALTAYSVYRGQQGFPGEGAMRTLASRNAGLGSSLAEGAIPEMQGQLPGPAEAGIQQGLDAAKAAIRSRYAGMGLTGSTMEAQDIANADMAAVSQRFAIGQQMAATGLSAAFNADTLATELYSQIMNGEIAQGTQLGDALAAFAGASVPGSPVVNPGG